MWPSVYVYIVIVSALVFLADGFLADGFLADGFLADGFLADGLVFKLLGDSCGLVFHSSAKAMATKIMAS